MTLAELIAFIGSELDQAGIPYMIVGSLASNFHGVPRSTRDADFVVDIGPDGLDRLARALVPPLTLERPGSFEAVTGTMRHVIRLASSPFLCELFVRSDDAHDRERFGRRLRVRLLGRLAFVASP